jgi:hypothetical protein
MSCSYNINMDSNLHDYYFYGKFLDDAVLNLDGSIGKPKEPNSWSEKFHEYINFEDLGHHWIVMLLWAVTLIAIYMLANRSCGMKNWMAPITILLFCIFNIDFVPSIGIYDENEKIRWQFVMKYLIITVIIYFYIRCTCGNVDLFYFVPLMMIVSFYLSLFDTYQVQQHT